ncbi:MAG: cupin domain-containing protein [Hyphomicrobiaceae bacterium]
MLDTVSFESRLKTDGYVEIERKRYEPRPANGEHGHHFSVRGLILDGAFIITLEGVERTYRPGEIFEVEAGRMHFEAVGQEGVELLVGRKY